MVKKYVDFMKDGMGIKETGESNKILERERVRDGMVC